MYDTEVRHTNAAGAAAGGRVDGHAGVRAEGLGKRFDDRSGSFAHSETRSPHIWAVRDLDLDVAPGRVLGLLGHNGAGKTTAIRMLTTLSRPTEGHASVAGFDVVTHGADVRRCIGVAAQQATVDPLMDARLNLELIGRLNQLPKAEARRRAEELLARLDLTDAAGRLVKTFSGGMRRRLDLAACLVATPSVLFLDEPTTGLDPRSREDLWLMLRDLVDAGTTLILTTQYLEEADRLADHIVVMDHGRSVATGTPTELKRRIGGDRIEVTLPEQGELVAAGAVMSPFASGELSMDGDSLTVTASISADVRIVDVVRALDEAGIDVTDVNRRQATLDDVFLTLTSPGAQP